MRTIEFRGKNQSGVWLYGDLQQRGNAIDTDGIDLGGDTFTEIEEDTIRRAITNGTTERNMLECLKLPLDNHKST